MFWIVYLVVTLPIQVTGLVLFLIKRRSPHCLARSVPLAIPLQLALMGYPLIAGLHASLGSIPCAVRVAQIYLLVGVSGAIYAIRAFIFFFKCELAHEKLAALNTQFLNMVTPESSQCCRCIIKPDPFAFPYVQGFFLKNSFLISRKVVYPALFVLLMLPAAFGIYDVVNGWKKSILFGVSMESSTCNWKLWHWISSVWALWVSTAMISFALLLRKKVDAFNVNTEFTALGLFSLLIAIGVLFINVLVLFDEEFSWIESLQGFDQLPISIICFFSCILSCWMPSVFAIREEYAGNQDSSKSNDLRTPEASSIRSRISKALSAGSLSTSREYLEYLDKAELDFCAPEAMKTLIKNLKAVPGYRKFMIFVSFLEGEKAFENHLVQELSIENMMFWKDVALYHQVTTHDLERFPSLSESRVVLPSEVVYEIKQRIVNVIERYFLPEAPLQINVSHQRMDELDILLQELEMSTFDPRSLAHVFLSSLCEVLNLMISDSFRRYQLTPDYSKILSRMQSDKIRRETISSPI